MSNLAERKIGIKHLFVYAVFISFVGWIWETVFVFFIYGPNDRGFLLLPVCPIYGFAVVTVYILIKTPDDMKIFGKMIFPKNKPLRYIAYFICSLVIATLVELFTGLVFDGILGVELWTYSGWGGNILGYIAVLPSLVWGVAITLFMRFLFYPCMNPVLLLKEKILNILFWIFAMLLLLDFAFNIIYLIVNEKHFDIPFFDMLYRKMNY